MADSDSSLDELRRALAALRRGELTADEAEHIATQVPADISRPRPTAPGLAALFGSELLSASADEARARIRQEANALTQFHYRPGDRIGGRYEVLSLHSGAFGLVALCHSLGPESFARGARRVALKTPLPARLADPELRELFLAEASHCVALGPHPNLVLAYGVEEHNRLPFLVLECVPDARTLTTDICAGTTDWRTALRVGLGVARGLAFARLIHSDLKPDNLLIGPDGAPKVADFGLALAPDEPDDPLLTIGTNGFRAPELWRHESRSVASDVFAFGVTLYVAATRVMPFDHRTAPGAAGPAPDVRQFSPTAPAAFASFLARCLALAPAQRPGDFHAIADELAALHRQLLGTAPPDDTPPDVPARADALVNAAQSWLNLGRPAKALAAVESALALAPQHWKAHLVLGLAHLETGDAASAEPHFARAAALAPAEPAPLANLALARARRGATATALEAFGRAVRLAHDAGRLGELDSVSQLAIELLSEHDAYNFLAAVLSANPTAAMTWNNRAVLLRRMGAYAEALDNAGRALALNPTYAKAYVQKANALLHLQRFAEAREAAQRALALDPSLAGAHAALSTALLHLGEPGAALAAIERGLRQLPGDSLLERARAQLQVRRSPS